MRLPALLRFLPALVPLALSLASAAEGPRTLHLPWRFLKESVRPATAEEAAAYILSLLSADERQLFLSTSEDALIRFHIGLGTGIRNQFGLWRGNAALAKSMGPMHPESMSAVIIQKVWEQVRSDAGPDTVRQVDAIDRTLRALVLPNEQYQWSGYSNDKHRLTTAGELVADLNAAAAEFFRRPDSDSFARLSIELVGRESALVSIRNRQSKPMSNIPAPQSFTDVLRQLGPPPGRYYVLYEGSVVRLFEREAKDEESAPAAAPMPASITPPAASRQP